MAQFHKPTGPALVAALEGTDDQAKPKSKTKPKLKPNPNSTTPPA